MSEEASQAAKARAVQDLSAEILRSVRREPGDSVRCTRVGAHTYRCNWWAAEHTAAYDNPSMGGLMVTTHRVRKSEFLTVTKRGGQLIINGAATPIVDDLAPVPPGRTPEPDNEE